MKTTLEVPDAVFRKAKAKARERGQSLKDFVTEALQDKLRDRGIPPVGPAWMRGFGKLRSLRKETTRIQVLIKREFDVAEPDDRT